MTTTRTAFLVLPLFCLLQSACAWALSDNEKADEAKIYAKEESEEKQMTLDAKTSFTGTITITDDTANADSGVIGTFSLGGRELLLRSESPKLTEDLKKLNGKQTTLTGKLRVNGKYFVAQSLLVAVPGPPRKNHGKRGGA